MVDQPDWRLNPVLYNRIALLFGPIEVDMFATRLTTKCPAYFSWWPDPFAVTTDVFLQDWSHIQ